MRKPSYKIYLTQIALQQLKASAAECYKQEADGALLGRELGTDACIVQAVWTIARADKRTYWQVETPTAHSIAEPFLSEWRVGGWHSHPDSTVHLSDADKKDCWDMEVVVAVHYGPRGWRFRFGGYWEPESGVWRRAKLVLPGKTR